MSTPPVNAEDVVARAIYSSLAPLMTGYQFAGSARCYYQVAPEQAPMPFLVYQLQSDINAVQRVGAWDGNGLILLRAVAETPSAARTLLGVVASGMDSLTVSGYHIQAVWDGSQALPGAIGYAQAALRYNVSVRKA